MNRLWIALWLLFSYPAWATITTVQTKTGTVSTSSCAVTVTALGVGHSGIFCVESGNTANVTLSSVSGGGGTWVVSSASHGTDTLDHLDSTCAYNLAFSTGSTTVTGTMSGSPGGGDCVVYEFSTTGTGFAFDTGNGGNDGTCTTCAGVALTLNNTSNNHALVQSIAPINAVSAINQSYTFTVGTNGSGFGVKINVTTAGTTPSWTESPTGPAALSGIAIYETVAVHTMMPAIY